MTSQVKLNVIISPNATVGLNKFQTVFHLIQNYHVAQQRKQYDAMAKVFDPSYHAGVQYPTPYPAINQEWFYFLILRNRFERNLFSGYEEMIYCAMSHWLENSVPACNICGYYAIGDMCRGTDLITPPYLKWNPVYLNDQGELRKCLARNFSILHHMQKQGLNLCIGT